MAITRMALMLWVAGAVAHAGETQQKLTVYLRVETPDRQMITPLAQDLAAKMFARVGIFLDWKSGEPAGDSLQPPIIVEVVSESESLKPGVLAYALPYVGSHIAVFLSRIEKTEYPAYVLAHVMVHEITHVVQSTSRHSDGGVMKPYWNCHDLFRMRLRPLPFAPEDRRLIYHGLSARQAVKDVAQ